VAACAGDADCGRCARCVDGRCGPAAPDCRCDTRADFAPGLLCIRPFEDFVGDLTCLPLPFDDCAHADSAHHLNRSVRPSCIHFGSAGAAVLAAEPPDPYGGGVCPGAGVGECPSDSYSWVIDGFACEEPPSIGTCALLEAGFDEEMSCDDAREWALAGRGAFGCMSFGHEMPVDEGCEGLYAVGIAREGFCDGTRARCTSTADCPADSCCATYSLIARGCDGRMHPGACAAARAGIMPDPTGAACR
jgi:hypothetical protein